jgi:hypothetical protein
VTCPQCGARWWPSKLIFRRDFRCSRCQSILHVSPTYSRALVLLSAFTSLALLWLLGIRDLRLCLFYVPVGFLVLTIMVRFVPLILAPRLFVGELSRTTGLNLSESSSSSFHDDQVG